MFLCPMCRDNVEELVDFAGEKMCLECAEHFANQQAMHEDDLRSAEKDDIWE